MELGGNEWGMTPSKTLSVGTVARIAAEPMESPAGFGIFKIFHGGAW